mmetsp:Transcript_12179/g.22440  ORF Transcript_12179/g.22440 Transcript_12179/m.22440 type:complete len:642 (+) Transcript_12179:124-2049(+)
MQLLHLWICLGLAVPFVCGDASSLVRSHQLGHAEVHSSGLISAQTPGPTSEDDSYDQAIAEAGDPDSLSDLKDEVDPDAQKAQELGAQLAAWGEGARAAAAAQDQPDTAHRTDGQQPIQLATEGSAAGGGAGQKASDYQQVLLPGEEDSSKLQDTIGNVLADGESELARDQESRMEAGQLLHEYVRKTELEELRGLLGTLVLGEQARQRQEGDHLLTAVERKAQERLRKDELRQLKNRQQQDKLRERQQQDELRELKQRLKSSSQLASTTPARTSEVLVQPATKHAALKPVATHSESKPVAIHAESRQDHGRRSHSSVSPTAVALHSSRERQREGRHADAMTASQAKHVSAVQHQHDQGSQESRRDGHDKHSSARLHRHGAATSSTKGRSVHATKPGNETAKVATVNADSVSSKHSFYEDVLGTTANAGSAEVACPPGSVMTSCACRELDKQNGHCTGAEIQATVSSPKCVAYGQQAVTAHARCGKVSGAIAWSTVRNRDSLAGDTSQAATHHESAIEVACPIGKVATGCSCSSAAGSCKSMHLADGTCIGYGVSPKVQSRCVLLSRGWSWSMVSNGISSAHASVSCPEGHLLTGCTCYAADPSHCGGSWMQGKICEAQGSSGALHVAAQGICIGLNVTSS